MRLFVGSFRFGLALTQTLALAQTNRPSSIPLGDQPRPKAEAYEAHAKVGNLEIGAEFMVRSFSRGDAMYVANDYVTVEVALYAPKGESVEIAYSDFQLRVNGKKQTLPAQNPYIVASSVAHPDWQAERPGIEAIGGVGNTRVTLGGPARTPLPAGAPPDNPAPTIPQVPKPDPPEGVDRIPVKTADQIAIEAALPEGKTRAPVGGFLYFAYTGSNKSIKKVELLSRDTVLKLR
jgi:hypothetical protein